MKFFQPDHPTIRDEDRRLFQEQLVDKYGDHRSELLWAMAVCCTIIQRTRRNVAVRIMNTVLDSLTPNMLVNSRHAQEELLRILTPLGLQHGKQQRIVQMTRSWYAVVEKGEPLMYMELDGVGPYFDQSWEMIVLGEYPPSEAITDHYLRRYFDEHTSMLA
jgi:hypothetical protein